MIYTKVAYRIRFANILYLFYQKKGFERFQICLFLIRIFLVNFYRRKFSIFRFKILKIINTFHLKKNLLHVIYFPKILCFSFLLLRCCLALQILPFLANLRSFRLILAIEFTFLYLIVVYFLPYQPLAVLNVMNI